MPGANEQNMGSAPQDLDELRYIHQVYQNQYQVVSNSINIELQELQQLNMAQKSLESSELMNEKEILTNVGGDVYMRSKISDAKSAIIGIGGGYLIEKDVDASKNYIAKWIERKTESINKLIKNKRELEAALIDIAYKIDKASR